MVNTKKSLVRIAKTGAKKPTARKPATRKNVAAKKPVVKLTPAQERDLKAKQKVDELLKDSTLISSEDDLLVLDESNGEPKGVEWLEEQVTLQGIEIERLRKELGVEKENNINLAAQVANGSGGDGEVTKKVNMLFDELQTNYLKMGKNPSTGAPNLIIAPTAFLNRMIQIFPFLTKRKQF